ncbi:hypothetical protein [Streptomyces sp. NPDC047028]|uniref:Lsr2 family DNA-binding protein n=1 Tax=Streptomyces sp. NPDC047028 TaxID=3155793 RepID=UPI0033C1307C
MTIAALLNLLDEIDHQGGPEAARQWRLNLPDLEGTPEPMTTAPAPILTTSPALPAAVSLRPPAADADPEKLPVGRLLAWGDQHDDQEVQAQAARARAALVGLRARYASDRELTALASEEEQLAEIRARKDELTPAKPRKKRPGAYVRDYDTRTVRAWADANGVDCPRVGQIPKRVLEAWRASQRQAG